MFGKKDNNGFNTASGMRSHATMIDRQTELDKMSFNTASGMRSHATQAAAGDKLGLVEFQYRKRYEVTCDTIKDEFVKPYGQVSIPQAV